MSGDDGRDNAHCRRDDERGFVNSGILFSLSSSVQFVGLILPSNSHAEIKTRPLRLCNLPDLRRLGCVTSAHLEWPVWSSSSGNNCHAVHRSLPSGASLKWDLHLVPYYQPSTPARFLSIIGHWDVSHPLSSELQVWSSSSGNNYRAVHRSISSDASLFFYGTVRIFTLSHIVSQAVFSQKGRATHFTRMRLTASEVWHILNRRVI